MVMAFVEATTFCLISYGSFPDTKWVFDPDLLELCVGTLHVYILSRGVVIILATSFVVRFIYPLIGVFL